VIYRQAGKRILDVLLSAMVLVPLAPVLVAAGALVRLTSRGPALYRQERLGRDASVFTVYKLRTMTDRDRNPTEEIDLGHPEVTPIGRWLRRTKLDEAPQLVNVLRGEMSLIGPRPALPTQFDALDEPARRRLEVRPGLTGLAQVNGNIYLSWPERWRYDSWYVEHLSFGLDLRIATATLAVLLLGEEKRLRKMRLPNP
jgi:undecaprenyl phosphate N,N'-diacetylbacillosamine 1-phosphate transferase